MQTRELFKQLPYQETLSSTPTGFKAVMIIIQPKGLPLDRHAFFSKWGKAQYDDSVYCGTTLV